MTSSAHRPSAVVYDFASRSRAILEARGQHGRAVEQAVRTMPTVEYGSGSYHEAALREDDRGRKQ